MPDSCSVLSSNLFGPAGDLLAGVELQVLPEVTVVQMEVGVGSWYSLKRILTDRKDRCPEILRRETTQPSVDSAASEVIAKQTGDGENISESEESNCVPRSSEIPKRQHR
ncbi:hypothetical protein SADUNF_Sadunf08G0138600 [Salix dunnii]|uniref:Uncharacterized protein n=1 Tax=Salix dunnii TaxID=1413687 RepID=A0A835N1P0_9ROSI|nr:hypothetical protein SADUNF_Sadunf08G0138600 [Salix dunnii]